MAALLVVPLAISACGSDNEVAADTDRFCELARAYDDATSELDISDPETFVAGLEAAAGATQEMADAAPVGFEDDATALASAAGDLVDRLRGVDYRTMDDLFAAMQEATDDLQAEYGTLDPETDAVIKGIEETCGFAVSNE